MIVPEGLTSPSETFFSEMADFRGNFRFSASFRLKIEELFRSVIEKVQSSNEKCRLVIEFSFSYTVKIFALQL